MVVLGQYNLVLLGIKWYWVSKVFLCLNIRVSQKKQKSEFWNVPYPSGFHRLDEP